MAGFNPELTGDPRAGMSYSIKDQTPIDCIEVKLTPLLPKKTAA